MRQGWAALLSGVLALGLLACDPREVRLFDGVVALDAGSVPPVEIPATSPAAPNDASRVPPAGPQQPDCLSPECQSCAALVSCTFADTSWLCHPRTGGCHAPCDPNGPEPQCPPGQSCHAEYGLCVDCVTATSCSGATPVCDSRSNTCVQCELDSDCLGQEDDRICDPGSHECVECTRDEHCTEDDKPFCSLSELECEDEPD